MKYYLDGIVVVEGSGDASYLSSFIESEYVITNGYEIPEEDVKYLQAANKKTQIFFLTDPDKAGKSIRERLKTKVKGIDLNVDIKFCNKNGKHGVAECEKNEVIKSVKPFLKEMIPNISQKLLTIFDLEKLNINNNEKYLFIGKKFNAYARNRKQLLRRLNRLEISFEQLQQVMEESRYGN